jgi:hypothetical protein
MWHVNVINEDSILVRQGNGHVIDRDGAGIEVRVEPDSNIRVRPVLRDAALFAEREVPNHFLALHSILASLKPTWSTAPHNEKVESLVVACWMAAEGRDYGR